MHPSLEGVCMRVVVMGGKGVGKSALAVRFLTKRYIGEYQSTAGKLVVLWKCLKTRIIPNNVNKYVFFISTWIMSLVRRRPLEI